jgi:hypothetical protein
MGFLQTVHDLRFFNSPSQLSRAERVVLATVETLYFSSKVFMRNVAAKAMNEANAFPDNPIEFGFVLPCVISGPLFSHLATHAKRRAEVRPIA